MVLSRINKNVAYIENREINSDDMGHESSVYELYLFNKGIVITLGKPKYTFIKQHIIFYPIYIISTKNGIEGQIGLFEIIEDKLMSVLDEEGDVDITKLDEPLLFEFSERIINRTNTDVANYLMASSYPEYDAIEDDTKQQEPSDYNTDHDSDDEDILKLSKKQRKSNVEKNDSKEEDIFIIDNKFQVPESTQEETHDEAEMIKSEFKQSSQNNWLQIFMKNVNYEIHNVESNGDCFFAVIRDAFNQIGKQTTVKKLRKILADEITDEVFQEYKTLYLSLDGVIKNHSKNMDNIKHTLEKDLKQRSKNPNITKKDAEVLVNEARKLKGMYNKLIEERKETYDLMNSTTGNLSNIVTFNDFKDHIMTSNYWADSWAISTIEKRLNIKMIIFNEESYNEGALNSVLNCGEVNKEIQSKGIFKPEYYITTTYNGNHYNLVSYKNKKILNFNEIPYHVKTMIINKCFEKNSGIYYLIQDFRNLKSKLDIEPDEGNPIDDVEKMSIDGLVDGVYDPDIVFMFHQKSENRANPGTGSGEKIPKDKMNEFIPLRVIQSWRRKLDDSWMDAPFTIDGNKYASVEHYYQGSKFKNGFPDFAFLFSLNSGSDISKDITLCKNAGGKSGKYKTQIVRPKNIKIDPDFYPIRNKEEREKAVMEKFKQNMDMKDLILKTNHAKLVNYVTKNPPETDNTLMSVREYLRHN